MNLIKNFVKELDRASKAKAILDSPLYQESFEMVKASILRQIELLPLASTTDAEDLRKCLKLLNSVRGNLTRALENGKVAAFELEREKQQKTNPFRGLFR